MRDHGLEPAKFIEEFTKVEEAITYFIAGIKVILQKSKSHFGILLVRSLQGSGHALVVESKYLCIPPYRRSYNPGDSIF